MVDLLAQLRRLRSLTVSGQLSRPPAGTFVTAYGQSLVSVVMLSADGDRAYLYNGYTMGHRTPARTCRVERPDRV